MARNRTAYLAVVGATLVAVGCTASARIVEGEEEISGPSAPSSPSSPTAPSPSGDAALAVVDASPPGDAGSTVIPGTSFAAGVLGAGAGGTGAPRPERSGLLALPGGGVGGPVLTSNNPEIFTGDGVLYANVPSPTRGGTSYPLSGDFGIYVHHINQAGTTKWVSILVTNPNASDVTVSLRGSGYSQDETGGLALGASPDYRVSKEWIEGTPRTDTGTITIAPGKGAVLWASSAGQNREIDARFAVKASAAVRVYIVATSDGSLQKSLDASQPIVDAPGEYLRSGNPPPPFGREAGIYRHDTWRSTFDVEVPDGPKHVAFMVNTATGGGLSQVQAFPALTHYDVSAREAVGMYGNVYDVDLGLRNTVSPAAARRVRVAFHSLANGTASRWWDGAALVDGNPLDVRHVPGNETTTLFDGVLAPGETRRLRFRAMVPGLAAIPQALSVETFGALADGGP
ncbi:MAG: DUF3370 family protein [Myxococcales bacterium]|nr:DUF3370 family protein [Myxococcales bacterium]